MVSKFEKGLVLTAWIGMFLVLIGGVLVTHTDSGQGCGSDWPLCHGKFVPADDWHSIIEYMHRAISGLEGLLVIALFFIFFRKRKQAPLTFTLTSITFVFTCIQALMGAMAVVFGQVPAVMALHYGFSLIAYTSIWLLMLHLCWPHVLSIKQGSIFLSKGVCYCVLACIFYTYGVVYTGAYVRHTHTGGICMGWPLCQGKWFPIFDEWLFPVVIHRVAAGLLFLFIAILTHVIYRRAIKDMILRRLSVIVMVSCLLQILSGAFIVFSQGRFGWHALACLVHSIWIILFFGCLCLFGMRIWRSQK